MCVIAWLAAYRSLVCIHQLYQQIHQLHQPYYCIPALIHFQGTLRYRKTITDRLRAEMTQTETITEKAVELEREGEKIVTDLAKKDGMSVQCIHKMIPASAVWTEIVLNLPLIDDSALDRNDGHSIL